MQRAQETRASDAGFAMAALMVAMCRLAVVMSVLLRLAHASVRRRKRS
jgi:hypothetical protein